jgi:hypothetical protein
MGPSPGLASLHAGTLSRSPAGKAMFAALRRKSIAQRGPAWGGPALGPQFHLPLSTASRQPT